MKAICISAEVYEALKSIPFSDSIHFGGILLSNSQSGIDHVFISGIEGKNGTYSPSNKDFSSSYSNFPNTDFCGIFRIDHNGEMQLTKEDMKSIESLCVYLAPGRTKFYYLLWTFDKDSTRPKLSLFEADRYHVQEVQKVEYEIDECEKNISSQDVHF